MIYFHVKATRVSRGINVKIKVTATNADHSVGAGSLQVSKDVWRMLKKVLQAGCRAMPSTKLLLEEPSPRSEFHPPLRNPAEPSNPPPSRS